MFSLNKKDWLFSGITGAILIGMIASNIYLMIILLSMRTLQILIYGIILMIILFIINNYHYRNILERDIKQTSWIKNNILFWMMTDLHTIIIISRYIIPSEKQGGILPEALFLLNLLLIYPVYKSHQLTFYLKHQFIINFTLYLFTYIIISFSFIQVVIQTMQ